ncbi:hypothetical protein A2276_00905 [candidate division WOR-1 bacterium RIFOXYA12_FULL_43_27]|uniref:GDT1 family protein n=1 Tax=candidate division WOR-1 bacterium RIFOXYC2_FULL_46_14 TaxID=1802587 RepID=A0A1F4U4K9_UNCSA|nr:MAG: hypothetical protein A2276_00905 [candidate division WOR-1 bacterium RIFOXYA12_FULL_43_27]OGC20755.1 MAG: hypothetical protein A2292_06970 [candidate division WOR-1 bacterium RIFOXYB2_FULL_46_45]OGC31508.1 MAG: hypothetical protein A2232_04480 [candidate division WOR-1 bacterium RIFOXYA2_FULL_46_56]OGC39915.1 MAG: hypothetical protein A2438_05320 [candidate division WOR-1 bacterium RIFOXYC2_FULL_46_14]
MNLSPFLISFLMISTAELGDKTQLLTLGFATKFPAWEVIAAVGCASALLMAGAVLFGGIINCFVPQIYLQALAGILFISFGLWTLFGTEKEEKIEEGKSKSPFWIVFSGFLLAELGDKTQLATFALSAEHGAPLQIWLGATLGMLLINSIAALSGGWIKKMIPEKIIKVIGAAIFIVFGIIGLAGI